MNIICDLCRAVRYDGRGSGDVAYARGNPLLSAYMCLDGKKRKKVFWGEYK